jgi:hypothetical protein
VTQVTGTRKSGVTYRGMDRSAGGSPDALRSRVRDGDTDAFGELFGSFATHVYNMRSG